MGGPMPSLASGNMSCTAWANTWAAEWRMTLRPSSVSAATGVTSTSASGAHERSRNRPSVSRTTTIAAGSPRPGRPASRTAAPAVVPAATRIGAAGAGLAAALIGDSPLRWGRDRTRPWYRCEVSRADADGAVQPWPIDADDLCGPVEGAEQPQRCHDDQRGEDATEHLDGDVLIVEQVHRLVVSLLGVGQQSPCPVEFCRQNPEPDEHDGPSRTRVRNGEDADDQDHQTDDSDDDAVHEIGSTALPQPVPPPRPPAPDARSFVFVLFHGCPGFSFTNSACASARTASPSSSRPETKILRPSMPSMRASTCSSFSTSAILR